MEKNTFIKWQVFQQSQNLSKEDTMTAMTAKARSRQPFMPQEVGILS